MAIEMGDCVGGRYVVNGLLGQGSMGRVWDATDQVLDRRVALKEVMLPFDAGQRQRDAEFERLRVEARMLARLDHPNVVSVHDMVRHDGDPVIVMQFVSLPTLRRHLEHGVRWQTGDIVRIARLTAAALQHAHERGVVHRDIKPDNILCPPGSPDTLKVTDFGIARELDATTTYTLIGTPAYISPEQWEGGRAGPESDMWSLGVLLFELAEGHRPFDAPNPAAAMRAILQRDIPAMPNAGTLEPVIRALLVRDPHHRADAEQARQRLRAAMTRPVPPGADPTEMGANDRGADATKSLTSVVGGTVAGGTVSEEAHTTDDDASRTAAVSDDEPDDAPRDELGPLGVLSNFLATVLNIGVGITMYVAVNLPWASAEHEGVHVETRAWGDDLVWWFTALAVGVVACALLSGISWPLRRQRGIIRNTVIIAACLVGFIVLGIRGETATAQLVGLSDGEHTESEAGSLLAAICMAAVLLACLLRCYATYGDTAKK